MDMIIVIYPNEDNISFTISNYDRKIIIFDEDKQQIIKGVYQQHIFEVGDTKPVKETFVLSEIISVEYCSNHVDYQEKVEEFIC